MCTVCFPDETFKVGCLSGFSWSAIMEALFYSEFNILFRFCHSPVNFCAQPRKPASTLTHKRAHSRICLHVPRARISMRGWQKPNIFLRIHLFTCVFTYLLRKHPIANGCQKTCPTLHTTWPHNSCHKTSAYHLTKTREYLGILQKIWCFFQTRLVSHLGSRFRYSKSNTEYQQVPGNHHQEWSLNSYILYQWTTDSISNWNRFWI